MISIELDKNCDALHEDITLSVPLMNLHRVVDSYYFFLDRSISFEKDECERRTSSLKSLLQDWVIKVKSLNTDDVCFLPFDFSDEYIGCFRIVQLADYCVKLNYGFTQKMQGYSINPSKIEQFCISEADFIAHYNDFKMDKTDFVKDIETSITKLDID